MADVFISYSNSDRTYALDLAEALRAQGFSIWIDQTGIGGAKNWTSEIVEAIDACSTMVCLISKHSITSHNVAKELHLASEKGKHILPVVIEKVKLPANFEYPLAGLQRVYYNDRAAILDALVALHAVAVTAAALPALPKDDAIRIAVLPFDDLSPEHDNQWFADGMMDELISTLGSLEGVKVPPRSDVLHYRDHRKKAREIASETGVRYLIEGGVRKAKHKIRINASLTDTLLGEQIWADKYDGTFDDIFEFQESVSRQITNALKLTLTSEETQKVEDHETENAEAYELYLRGKHEQYYMTKESYVRALEYYEQAVKLDPKFARAQISIATLSCAYYREYSRNPKWLVRAEQSRVRAKEVTGNTSRTVMIEGMIAWLKGDRQNAIELFEQSCQMDPKNYNALNLLGAVNMEMHNYEGAVRAFERVVALVENTQSYFNLLNAIAQTNSREYLSQYALQAIPIFDRHIAMEPTDVRAVIERAFVLRWAGNREEAFRVADRLRERDNLDPQVLYELACLYSNLGAQTTIVSILRRAIDGGYRNTVEVQNLSLELSLESEVRNEIETLLRDLENLIKTEHLPG